MLMLSFPGKNISRQDCEVLLWRKKLNLLSPEFTRVLNVYRCAK